jgi:membrane-associated phospholipid phosphatase
MLAAKLSLLGCARPGALASPSGHTAAAAYVYGGMAALVLRVRALTAAALAGAVACLIGLSRVVLHAHSLAEVIAGGMVGVIVLCAFAWSTGRAPENLRPARLLFVVVPLMVVLHGVRLNMEPRVRLAAGWFGFCL